MLSRSARRRKRILDWRLGLVFIVLAQERPGPDQAANAGDEEDHTDNRPDDVFRGRFVAVDPSVTFVTVSPAAT